MKYFKLILVMVFLCSASVFSQEKYSKHTITKGETISSIAQKYKVKTSDIYELNPDCRGVLKLKSVLLIPTKNGKKETTVAEKETKTAEIIHEVLAKETLFGIAKQYGITLTDLNKANPKLETSGLKVGQKINVPVKEGYQPNPATENQEEKVVTEITVPERETSKQEILAAAAPIKEVTEEVKENVVYEVLQNETKYSIAKKYGVSVPDLEKANPILASESLKIGQKISIPVKEGFVPAPVAKETAPVVIETATPKQEVVNASPIKETVQETKESFVYEVLQNETKYSIAKKYGISVPELNKANPILETESLKIGQKITIPVKEGFVPETVAAKETEKIVQESAVAEKELPKQETVATIPVKEPVKELSEEIIREVLPRETKFGIAKQYGISVEELERQNPSIKRNLPVGFKLSIRNPNAIPENVATAEKAVVQNDEQGEKSSFIRPSSNIELVDQLIKMASDNIGTRYRSGGTSKAGFDCSGLMCTTFGAFDIKLPRSSFEQASYGTKISTEEAQKGDLIFFKTNGRSQINHVGMVVEVNEGEIKFIHSSVQRGVIISSTKEKYYERNFTQINRVLQ